MDIQTSPGATAPPVPPVLTVARPTAVERGLLVTTVLLGAVHVASTLLREPGTFLPWVDVVAYCGEVLAAILLCALRAVRDPRQRWAWHAVGLALSGWLLGAVWHGVVALSGDPRTYPSLGDWLSLTAFPIGGVALVLLLRGLVPTFRSMMWLDSLVAALGMAALAYPLALDRLIQRADGSVAVAAAALAFPVGGLLLVVLLGSIAGMMHRFASPMWLCLTLGLLASLVGNTWYAVEATGGSYVQGGPLDGWWSVSTVLIGAGAFLQPPSSRPEPREGAWWTLTLLPGTFALASLGLLLYGQTGNLPLPAALLALGSALAAGLRAVVTYRDASRLAETRRLARTDDLTGLPNRRGFTHALTTALRDRRDGRPVAVLLMDLDRFKEVNEALGHDLGDDLLRLVGSRVSACLEPGDLLARLGGDEFAIVLAERADASAATSTAERIVRALSRPFDLPEISLHVGASIGIVVDHDRPTDAHTLLRRADIAMYDAKARGDDYRLFDPSRDSLSRDRLETIEQLRAAIEGGELVLHYQPKIGLRSDRAVGVEALLRWQHPEHGLLGPDRFLPLAEHAGLMRLLTHHVLEQALRQLRCWHDAGWDLGVAVNISTSNLLDVSLAAHVASELDRHGVDPQMLTLEITESTIMADPTRAKQVVQELHDLGVVVSVDDYGTGYSSLAYLRHLAVRELKLDREFVRDITSEPRASAIVRSTVELAHSLGLAMVAEGVEDQQSAHMLRALGCDVAQGYHYGRPMPVDDLRDWLVSTTSAGPAHRSAQRA